MPTRNDELAVERHGRSEAMIATRCELEGNEKAQVKTGIMFFYSFFKTLVGKEVAVELKNDVALMGVLDSVDQYLNIKLLNVSVVEGDKFPQLMNMKNCFIRGSSIRYVQIPAGEVDTELLQDAARREATANKQS
ncbi:6 snRNA-associated Sm-like protein, putative [Phytophthora infestans T30-4]|uniref:6 snRNA-associated Sm-like protein, putative n=2 Tax=Phytophthora TaxID=4783 RepID=D0NP81_PHYIT|nr:6 snRNA-associated Sm-like protein, putative [Phytophthora infestans T30-4]EEY62423.1 6 snRNA-associated Sm-like protein, putative [Phytophthora infestans T30-4]|eukprot:XP_002899059.1 6 snRNA-associated Sm-like protein, putative [Phytophthora infestans T30-4]